MKEQKPSPSSLAWQSEMVSPIRASSAPAATFVLALLLIILLVAWVPLFLCLPPWLDNAFFDVCAQTVLRGKILYQEVFLHGLPGMVLLQAGIRYFFGWSSETLRLADLIINSAAICLLVRVFLPRSATIATRLATALFLYGFYFSTSEWMHCQPDQWMLLPALAALWLRHRQVVALANPSWKPQAVALRGVFEGLLWGYAFLMKPFVAVPALACWVVGAAQVAGRKRRPVRGLVLDVIAVLCGGVIVGGACIAWMHRSGNWHPFLEAMFGTWNEEYYSGSAPWAARSFRIFSWFLPWGFLHLLALPLALVETVSVFERRRAIGRPSVQPLLAACYLAWLFQANYLQRQMPYQQLQTFFLAITVLAGSRAWLAALALAAKAPRVRWIVIGLCVAYALSNAAVYTLLVVAPRLGIRIDFIIPGPPPAGGHDWIWMWSLPVLPILTLLFVTPQSIYFLRQLLRHPGMRPAIVLLFGIAALYFHPFLQDGRPDWWWKCCALGSTPQVRNALQIERTPNAPDWVRLAEVADFLRSQHVRDHELTCYALSSVHLYKELGVEASTPFVLLWAALINFKQHHEEIAKALQDSPQRFIINDLRQWGVLAKDSEEQIPGRPFGMRPISPNWATSFPWPNPVVFRAGRYLVHAVRKREQSISEPSK